MALGYFMGASLWDVSLIVCVQCRVSSDAEVSLGHTDQDRASCTADIPDEELGPQTRNRLRQVILLGALLPRFREESVNAEKCFQAIEI